MKKRLNGHSFRKFGKTNGLKTVCALAACFSLTSPSFGSAYAIHGGASSIGSSGQQGAGGGDGGNGGNSSPGIAGATGSNGGAGGIGGGGNDGNDLSWAGSDATWATFGSGVGGYSRGGEGGTGGTGGDGGVGGIGGNGGLDYAGGAGGNGGNGAVGGVGGNGGAGGDITAVNPASGTIQPTAVNVHVFGSSYEVGMALLSIGGWGGEGGAGGNGGAGGAGGTGGWYWIGVTEYYYGDASDGITGNGGAGGVGGNGGAGGQLSAANYGTIKITDAHGVGIGADSTGGDGGMGGAGGSGTIYGANGTGGAGGNGGDVSINNAGKIELSGISSYGLVGLSIGGDGGDGGYNGVTAQGNGGAAGNGGDVTIVNSGTVSLSGVNGSGIIAMSFGGDGGYGTSDGLDGDGGNIVVNNSGAVVVSGADSVGIDAESHGRTAGNVEVNVLANGSVSATGNGSYGIVVRSDGDVADGTLAVTIGNKATVTGGNGGVGVYFDDYTGQAASLLVSEGGLLTTASGVDGYAAVGENGDDVVNNYGTIVGSVDLDDGANAFNNYGTFKSGDTVYLGAGNLLYNNGLLQIGGADETLATALTGNFQQDTAGKTVFKIGGTEAGTTYDQLIVSGTADLKGKIATAQFGTYVPNPGDTFDLLTAAGGITGVKGTDWTFDDYFIKNYLVYIDAAVSGNDLVGTTKQRFFLSDANNGTLATTADDVAGLFADGGLTHNERAVAEALDNAIANNAYGDGTEAGWGTGGQYGLDNANGHLADKLVKALNKIPKANLPYALNLISPDELGVLAEAGVSEADAFLWTLQRRLSQIRDGVGNSIQSNSRVAQSVANDPTVSAPTTQAPLETAPGWHVFAMENYHSLDIDDNGNAFGGKDSAFGTTVGIDARVSDSLALGLALNYTRSDFDLSEDGEAEVDSYKLALFGTWYKDNLHVDAAAGAGYNDYDKIKRGGLGGVTASGLPIVEKTHGDTTGDDIDGLLSVGYDVKMNKFTLTPMASAYYTTLSIDGYTENGTLAPLTIDDIDADSLQSSLGAVLAYDAKIGSVPVKPEVGVFWNHEFLDDSYNVDARLASGAGTPFSVESTDLGRDSVPVWLGVGVQATQRLGVHLAGGSTLFRDNVTEYTGVISLDYGF